MLSTDGFANSYKNEAEFKKTCQDYYDMIKQHGPSAVDANLKAWLEETSELGCGDDISAMLGTPFEKPGEFPLAFHFYYADVRKRSIILVLAIFLYRMDGIIIVTANKNG